MLFNSFDFILFLPTVLILYFLTPHKFRWILLLAASYFFYMSWKVEYIFLILFSTLVDYFIALKMERINQKKKRLPWLLMSIATNLGLLFFFKYYSFATNNANGMFQSFGIDFNFPHLDFLLPVGISFYTFQTLSYSIDVYNGRQQAERHLGYFALVVEVYHKLSLAHHMIM